MPLPAPSLDSRTFQDIVAEMLGRIPIHNPEWTNFSRSDPGVTILEVAAFLLENDIYVANQIPERNRRKFLQLLSVPLQPGAPAAGLVTIADDRGPLTTLTLNDGVEVRAGAVPFRTTQGLDVLPIEAQVFYKKAVDRPEVIDYYNLLHASQTLDTGGTVSLYETTPLGPDGFSPGDAIDRSLWIALFARKTEAGRLDDVRREIAGKTLNLGVAPIVSSDGRRLAPGVSTGASGLGAFRVLLPRMPPNAILPDNRRQPDYQALNVRADADVLTTPGVVEIALPNSPAELRLWQNLTALESGTGDFPPSIDDTEQAARLITWLRVRSPSSLLWVGINCVPVTQRAHVASEVLPDGTGEPDQTATLSQPPIAGTVQISVTPDLPDADVEAWEEIDDLLAAGPEVPAPDPSLPPGAVQPPNPLVKVFAVDAEAALVRFGDGLRGARPPAGAKLRAAYDHGQGRSGNVAASTLDRSPALPGGWTVTNPLPTWGGADPEAVSEGEKQVPRFLQHRDRLVTAEDFETLAWRTPGVDIGRVEVLAAFHPDLSPNLPGDVAGVVTLLLLPRYDAATPAAPQPDKAFLDAVACWLDPRRLVTTEVILRGPAYVPVQAALAIEVVAGFAEADVREAVKARLTAFLSPLPATPGSPVADRSALLSTPTAAAVARGWPLGKAVSALELQAEASRVPGVQVVHPVNLYKATLPTAAGGEKKLDAMDSVSIDGLQLPWLLAIDVGIGDTPPGFDDTGVQATAVPVPVIPEECR